MIRVKLLRAIALVCIMLFPLSRARAGVLCDTLKQGARQVLPTSYKVGSEVYSQYGVRLGNQQCGITGKTGSPGMPCRYVTFSVPYKSGNFSVSANVSSYSDRTLSRMILPVQEPVTTAQSISETDFTPPDSSVYGRDEFCLDTIARIVGEGYMYGDNHYVTVEVAVANYNPKASKLRVFTSVSLKLTFDDEASNAAIVPISRNNSVLGASEREGVKSIVANAGQVEDFAAPATAQRTSSRPSVPDFTGDTIWQTLNLDSLEYGGEYAELAKNNEFEYTIITSNALLPAFKKIIALKRQRGYYAGAVTVERILANSLFKDGDKMGQSVIADSAGSVREYLKYAFTRGTKYVLLGGKAPYCPFRYGHGYNYNQGYEPSEYSRQSFIDEMIPSDLYFSNLSQNWNIDNDVFYGEKLPNQSFDYSPSLYVGRLLCSSMAEIENYTDKLLRYVLWPGNGDSSYAGRAFISECNGMQTRNEAGLLSAKMGNLFQSTTIMKEYENDIYGPQGADFINKWNFNQYGYVSMHGHGSPMGITVNYATMPQHKVPYSVTSLDSLNAHTMRENGNGLDCLKNKQFPSVMYSIACEPMPYDIYMQDDEKFSCMNMGESFTLGKDYGGVAFLGNTRYGLIGTSNKIEMQFMQAMNDGQYNIGVAEALSKLNSSAFASHHLLLTHNMLGDPEFDMHTSSLQVISGITVSRTNNSITVSGIDIDSATVAYCGNYMQGRVVAESDCVTFNNISPNSSIMVYKHNYIPYIAPLVIQNETICNSQYVFASTFTAGCSVDSGRSQGDVTFKGGAVYEVEATGDVSLGDGVVIEREATLKIMTPGKVHVSGVNVQKGGTLIVQAGQVDAPRDFVANKGGIVKIEKYTGQR